MNIYQMYADGVWHSLRPMDKDGDRYLAEHDRELVNMVDLSDLEKTIADFAVKPSNGQNNKYRIKTVRELLEYLYDELGCQNK